MVTCACGAGVTTNYCPACGRKNADPPPLIELLRHVKKVVTNNRNKAAWWRGTIKDADRDKQHDTFRLKRAVACDATADKWQRWADALEALFAGEDPKET